ncbi:MAG: DegT/DnrJ/EryC1/StrS family aminotransferase [Thiohalomonadales bacterium]
MFFELASSTWDDEERQAIQAVIDSDRYTMGERVKEFEEKFSEKLGKKYAVMVSSGSTANLISTAALSFKSQRPLQRGDEVIVPAISWATTYYPLQQYGLKLRFVDVDLDNLGMDVTKLGQALTPHTRMLVGVNILGNPAALDVMRAFCDQHDLYFFEDNCESLGAELNGQKCGTFGDISTFSFFFSHHIATMEGGMILTDDEELFHILLSLRAHGWVRDLPEDTLLCNRSEDTFEEAYRFILPGYNARPLEMSGAVGVVQLKKLDLVTQVRRKNADLFHDLFANDDRFILQKENGKSSYFSFTMIVKPGSGIQRDQIFGKLRQADIGFRMITGGNFLRHDVIRYFNYDVVDGVTPNADLAHDHGFFVGNQPYDIQPQLEKLQQVLHEIE